MQPVAAASRPLALAVSSSSFQSFDAGDDDNDSSAADTSIDRRGIRSSSSKYVLARGLARRFGDQRGRAEALEARISRQAKQLVILEEYNRRREADSSSSVAGAVATVKCSNDSHRAHVVGPVSVSTRSRRTSSLRAPASSSQDNQRDDDDDNDANAKTDAAMQSPTTMDLAPFAALASSRTIVNTDELHKACPSDRATTNCTKTLASTRGSSIDKSAAQMMCELHATKHIIVREQTLQQLRTLAQMLETLAAQLSDLQIKRASATAHLSAAAAVPVYTREKRGSTSLSAAPLVTTRRPESGQAAVAAVNSVATVECDAQQLAQQFAEVAATAQRRVQQFAALLTTLRVATIDVADAIVAWRHLRDQRCHVTNFRPLFRFPWRRGRVCNYLAHMDRDVQWLTDTAALRLVLGVTNADACSALLLPPHVLEALGLADASAASTTFLTERRVDSNDVATRTLAQHCDALHAAMQTTTTSSSSATAESEMEILVAVDIDLDRARNCLETLQREHELERAEAEHAASEQQRVAAAHNPFTAIKAVGGVEQALAHAVATQAPLAAARVQQLRQRQQDTSRSAVASPLTPAAATTVSPLLLRVNVRRQQQLLAQRKEFASAGDCETRSAPAWNAPRNKLRGQLVVRKRTLRRQQCASASAIQRQFRVHTLRCRVLTALTTFVAAARASAALIQRVFRGFCGKRRSAAVRAVRDAARRRIDAARCILHAFRRYRRRQRHRRSMTVESIAQAQLFSIQYQKFQDESGHSDDDDAVARYRRVGEARRQERVVLLQRRRREQLEVDARRNAAATTLQAFVRGHLAKSALAHLRRERQAHLTAVGVMTLQSQIRRFLKRQDARRQRFRDDLARVNRSAVRIQSTYRGYNSRASLCERLDETMHNNACGISGGISADTNSDNTSNSRNRLPPLGARPLSSTSDDDSNDAAAGTHDELHTMLALLASPPAAVHKASAELHATKLPPLRPSVAAAAPTRRSSFVRQVVAPPTTPLLNASQVMTRVELELKRPQIGDDFNAHPQQRRDRGGTRRSSAGIE